MGAKISNPKLATGNDKPASATYGWDPLHQFVLPKKGVLLHACNSDVKRLRKLLQRKPQLVYRHNAQARVNSVQKKVVVTVGWLLTGIHPTALRVPKGLAGMR